MSRIIHQIDYKSSYPPHFFLHNPFSIFSPSLSHQSSKHGSSAGSGHILIISLLAHALATLGSASNHASFLDLSDCAAFARPPLYPRRLYSTAILAVYDSDPAGDLAHAYLSQYPRVTLTRPPAHDLTDVGAMAATSNPGSPSTFYP
jgi:hypothetical protein